MEIIQENEGFYFELLSYFSAIYSGPRGVSQFGSVLLDSASNTKDCKMGVVFSIRYKILNELEEGLEIGGLVGFWLQRWVGVIVTCVSTEDL